MRHLLYWDSMCDEVLRLKRGFTMEKNKDPMVKRIDQLFVALT